AVRTTPEPEAAIDPAATHADSQSTITLPDTVDSETTTGSVPPQTDDVAPPMVPPQEDPEQPPRPRRSAPQESDALIQPATPPAARPRKAAVEDDGWMQPQNP